MGEIYVGEDCATRPDPGPDMDLALASLWFLSLSDQTALT